MPMYEIFISSHIIVEGEDEEDAINNASNELDCYIISIENLED